MKSSLYFSSAYLKVLTHSDQNLADQLRQVLGVKADQLLASEYILGDDIGRMFTAFEADGVDSLLLRYSRHLDITSHGPLGYAVLTAPDLDTALQVMEKYLVIRTSVYQSEYSIGNDRAEFITHDLTGEALAGRWLIETAINIVKRLIEAVMAHPLGDNAHISFAYPKPSYAKELQEFYGVRCTFGMPTNKISIPASWCQIRSPFYDQHVFSSNLAKCSDLKLSLDRDLLVHEFISTKLSNYFSARQAGEATARELPNLVALAAQLHMSPRTLTRKLKDADTSYKTLLEQARRAQAIQLLENTHQTIADVAYNLAYQEPANFVRAFKTWFDTTPAAWRRTPNKNNV